MDAWTMFNHFDEFLTDAQSSILCFAGLFAMVHDLQNAFFN